MCGIFGVRAPGEDVANITYFGLLALQHRGQESAGIAAGDDQGLHLHREMGLVEQAFNPEELSQLHGRVALGHTRYSTTGSSTLANAQPFLVHHAQLGPVAVAHNGNLINYPQLRADLERDGVVFETSSDTEVMARLLVNTPGNDWETVLRRALPRLEGAYSIGLVTPDTLIGVRDPYGFRPLVIGKLGDAPAGSGEMPNGRPARRLPPGPYVIASETCALDTVGAHHLRDVQPGEMVLIDERGVSSHIVQIKLRRAMCVFEFIYFARPDSELMGRSLYQARVEMGRQLAREAPVEADIVISLPDSGTPAAIGFAEASAIPYQVGLIKNIYSRRTFIEPAPAIRDQKVRLKLNPLPSVLRGKRIVVVDDSIVRGTTSRRMIEQIRRAGAAEIHMRISSPPMMFPCFMGIDIGSRQELIAANHSVEEIRELIGADSLHYLSMGGLARSVAHDANDFCFACFDGSYPVPVPQQLEMDKLSLEAAEPELPLPETV
ncbi:MAG: amidophosphoribosyltransferase [Candidatus Dormibacteria bacterium]